jgi:hypothetical protein
MRIGLIVWVDLLRWRRRGVVNLHLLQCLLRLNSRFLGRAWRGWGVRFRGACLALLRCTFSFDWELGGRFFSFFSFLLDTHVVRQTCNFPTGAFGWLCHWTQDGIRGDGDGSCTRVNTLHLALLDVEFPRMICKWMKTKIEFSIVVRRSWCEE